MKRTTLQAILLAVTIFTNCVAYSQTTTIKDDRCGTMQWLENMYKQYPQFREKFEANEKKLGVAITDKLNRGNINLRTEAIITVPIVFHIVTTNPTAISNAMIQAQLDTLNKDWSGLNKDSTKIPAAFKPLYGKGNIRFCLAQRNPDNLPSNGIVRIVSSIKSVGGSILDPIKYTAKGGDDAWDPKRFVNVWVTTFTDNTLLGYSTFPIGTQENANGFPLTDQGIVILPGSLPGGSAAPYNFGRTLSHEMGHFFWLRHIWGDANCGNDFPNTPGIDDTPTQLDATGGCPGGVVATGCSTSPTPPGRMYQNFMDYSDDACLLMFTKGQDIRSEQALRTFRAELLTSDGCTPGIVINRDVRPIQFLEPGTSGCDLAVKPVIVIRNSGIDTIKTFVVNYSINGGANNSVNFTGSLPYNQTVTVPLNTVTASLGSNTIKVYTSIPNGQADQNPNNDTLSLVFRILTPLNDSLVQGFEGTFPPVDWDVREIPIDNFSWKKTTRAGKNSISSAFMNNYNYAALDKVDDLVTPPIKYSGADSVFLKFDVAAATYSFPGSTAIPLDTLEVLASTDCGKTYTSVYKKFGYQLQTIGDPNNVYLDEFFPASDDSWRRDSINLTSLLGAGNTVRFAFRNTTNFENNIFIDNVNFSKKVLPARLKATGVLIFPNPFRERFVLQHYLQPTDLRGYGIYNSIGQQITTASFAAGTASSYIEIILGNRPPGVYTIKLLYTNRTASFKLLKTN